MGRDGATIKGAYCCFRVPEFGSQAPTLGSLQLPGIEGTLCLLLASMDTQMHVGILKGTYAYLHTNLKSNL